VDPLSQEEAVEFFLDRARAVKSDLRPAPAVAEICARLDRLPLALELAASRVKVLDPPLLLDRLDRALPLLTEGARDLPERQQTLRATIAWSYELLEPDLQRALRQLSALAGSFSLEAAEIVAEAGFDQVSALVDWSLLKPIGEGRFLMLETIREFGRELLSAAGELDAVRDRQLDFFLELVEEAEPELTKPDQRRWYSLLALEQDNIREALGYACESGDRDRALMLAGTIWRFWWSRGFLAEAELWYARAFAIEGEASLVARARGVFGLAHMTEARGDSEQARDQFEEAVELLRESGQTRLLISAHAHLVSLYRQLGDGRRSEAVGAEALELAQATGDVRGAAVVRGNLAYNLLAEHDDLGAARLFEEALDEYRVAGDVYGVASVLADLATIALRAGDPGKAASTLIESLELSSSIGDALTITWELFVAAAIALAQGDANASARLCGAVDALCRAHGFGLDNEPLLIDTTRGARRALGEDAFDEEWAAGVELDLDAAVAFAVSILAFASAASSEVRKGPSPLGTDAL
jgi:tetratricopeptide (TPR) repeat protein